MTHWVPVKLPSHRGGGTWSSVWHLLVGLWDYIGTGREMAGALENRAISPTYLALLAGSKQLSFGKHPGGVRETGEQLPPRRLVCEGMPAGGSGDLHEGYPEN